MPKERLPVKTFRIPYTEIRRGYRSAVYFWRTKKVMETQDVIVTMQFFQKKNSIVCGVDEAIAILKTCAGRYKDQEAANKAFDLYKLQHEQHYVHELNALWELGWDQLEVKALYDGNLAEPFEPVLQICGPYSLFAHLESVLLGVMARQTKIATNVKEVVSAANDKPVLMFADRFDHYATQGGDGYAAKIGGAEGYATDAMTQWWGGFGMGTMPHALIAAFGGDLVAACSAFHNEYPDVALTPLVDFHNNCVEQSLEVLEAFGDLLWGVRLDTSEKLVDKSLEGDIWYKDPTGRFGNVKNETLNGVSIPLVKKVRAALDVHGGHDVQIVVSGGFNAEKITLFEKAKAPVDVYAVGEGLLKGQTSYTADVVEPVAKVGRGLKPEERLTLVT